MDSRAICNCTRDPWNHGIVELSGIVTLECDGHSAKKKERTASSIIVETEKKSHTKPRTTTLERLGISVTGEKNGVWHNAPPAGRAPTSPEVFALFFPSLMGLL